MAGAMGPEIRMIPIPAHPTAVAMAAMVGSSIGLFFSMFMRTASLG
jgi:hypothetical protein